MIDPRREAVLIHSKKTGQFEDQTFKIARYAHQRGGRVQIEFSDGRQYQYGQDRVRVLGRPEPVAVTGSVQVEAGGAVWTNPVEILQFPDPEQPWTRFFLRSQQGESYRTFPASQVHLVDCAVPAGPAAAVTRYWSGIVADLDAEDPLVRAYRSMKCHPDSALHTYVTGAAIRSEEPPSEPPIFPFHCNSSQRTAVEAALTHNLSIIEGPPGTGKTETILNLIGNVVVRGATIGVVSHSNSAVDNVRDKLDELGFGHVLANLGNKEKRRAFFARQGERNQQVEEFLARTPDPPDAARLSTLDERLHGLRETERRRAEQQQHLAAHRLELQHFEQHAQAHDEMPDLAGLPLLRRSSERVLDYLAESELERSGARPGVLRRIRKYFKYGSLRGVDPGDAGVIRRLQRAYYDKRIAELTAEVERLDDELANADFDRLAREHKDKSVQQLHATLGARYRGLARTTYEQKTYRNPGNFRTFREDYPVLLSTCHSLITSLPEGMLLDHLVIDEASQVDPIIAGLALSCCRNAVVVGDTRQLRPIPPKPAKDHAPPSSAYDCDRHSILSSIAELHGDAVPRTLLREHYRCDPAIIGFCNEKFYDGDLIPFTSAGDEPAMIVRPTVEGNHMRSRQGGGRANQREIDVIENEVIPEHCKGVPDEDIGITTPYRLQASTAEDVLDQAHVDTVHRFQGRQKRVVVLTTVLDETREGHRGLDFVDDEPLINVAVSRAIERFVLVTNNDMMPRSRHVRDLVGHIDYQSPGQSIVDSSITSIFDLLYQNFSDRLSSLRRRLKKEMEYRSEDIAWTVLDEILGEQRYAHLRVATHVPVGGLLKDRTGLTPRQRRFVDRNASVDFLTYNRVSKRPVLAIEVDGDRHHANDPKQLERDRTKDEIFAAHDMPLLRLPTTGSGEQQRIRDALDEAEQRSARTRIR